ncbi:acetyl-CoA carboxylase biotin carboxyl carrier protein [Effusibacillus consociatus]|uniref:Biotin carboxyl carrier protein of acetyl-CoA carboxylase n=1 Tax=Effusibacillus consociatus TaxID=1117041 RepID=A0ABV9Q656_9BACL
MLRIHEIREIIKLLNQTDVEVLEVKDEQSRLTVKRRNHGGTSTAILNPIERVVATPALPAAPAPKISKEVVSEEKPGKPIAVPKQAQVAALEQTDLTDKVHQIVSPMIGTFYKAPAEDAEPFVKIGDRVEKSTVVCIVEAMKLFNEIEAEVNGEIVQVLVENGQLVEQGQPLFLVKVD